MNTRAEHRLLFPYLLQVEERTLRASKAILFVRCSHFRAPLNPNLFYVYFVSLISYNSLFLDLGSS